MQLKTERRPKLRDECYNCYLLMGGPFSPKCFALQDPSRDESKDKCTRYIPIVKEK